MTSPARWPREEQASIAKHGDPLPEYLRGVIGKSVQLRVPMRDAVDLRRTAEVLRAFANRMEVLSHSKLPSSTIMMTVYVEGRQAQARLNSRPKSG
jgi:hypothetical protein